MSTVELCDVRKSYDNVEIIRGISTHIKEGEFVALIGPSGCGKSTLLRMIAGLEPITSGEIRFGDRVVNDESPKDRNIAMVFQNYALYPHMTVRNNIGFALKQRNYSSQEINRRVQEAAEMLGLEPLLDRKPKALSGGQRQRVAMGRAIVRDPTVFLFDEPLSNLDAKLRGQMRTEIKELHQRLRTTTVYVTHDQIEAMTLADRVIVMNDGKVEQEGPPLELYDHPKTAFVAAFIGSPPMNFFQGNIIGNGLLQLDDGLQLPLPISDLGGKSRATIGVRPEHFSISENGWPATVSIIEAMGSETQITVRIGSQLVRVVQPGRTDARPGDTIRLTVSPELVHVFDSESIPDLTE